MSNYKITDSLSTFRDYSIEIRHELHRIPEPSGKEYKTAELCKTQLRQMGYKIHSYDGFTGFFAELIIDPSFTLIAFRADMDGLEMQDMTDSTHTSIHAGMAHNCGHDTHMAIALTTANYLSKNKSKMQHNVRFIFQMAEEDMRVPGADKMVELGCMKGVSEVYALHNDASMEVGAIRLNDGVMSSWGSAWTLDVRGVSAHGSTPHKGLDAIRETVRIIEDMDYVIAKQTNPFSPAVFGCGMINGGTIPNAVADYVQARGTIRAMDAETDAILKNSLTSLVAQSELRGFKTQMDYVGYPAVENNPKAFKRVIEAANKVLLPENIDSYGIPMTGSEDFSYMINATENRMGAMFFLGSGNEAKGIKNYLHSNPYHIDDDCILVGAQIFINLV